MGDEIHGSVSGGGNILARVGTVGQVGGRISVPVYQANLQNKTGIIPTKASQTIRADDGYDALESVTVDPIPDNYYDMSGPMYWLGKNAECIDDSVYSVTEKLKNTDFNTWTPSTTASVIVAAVLPKSIAVDLANYEYFLAWDCKCNMDYTGASPTLKAHFLFSRAYIVQQISKRPSTFANIQSGIFDGNICSSIHTANFLRYYGTTTGSITYSWSASYGIYFGASAATFSQATVDAPTMIVKTPTVSARCSTTYFSTGNAAKVNKDNSEYSIKGRLYRIEKKGLMRGIHENVVRLINE